MTERVGGLHGIPGSQKVCQEAPQDGPRAGQEPRRRDLRGLRERAGNSLREREKAVAPEHPTALAPHQTRPQVREDTDVRDTDSTSDRGLRAQAGDTSGNGGLCRGGLCQEATQPRHGRQTPRARWHRGRGDADADGKAVGSFPKNVLRPSGKRRVIGPRHRRHQPADRANARPWAVKGKTLGKCQD